VTTYGPDDVNFRRHDVGLLRNQAGRDATSSRGARLVARRLRGYHLTLPVTDRLEGRQ
jgi:hypothetical protein